MNAHLNGAPRRRERTDTSREYAMKLSLRRGNTPRASEPKA